MTAREHLGPGAEAASDPASTLTLWASERYVTRDAALDLHLGRGPVGGAAHFILPLRRALARSAPGAFDSPPRSPWRLSEQHGRALRLGLRADAAELYQAVLEAGQDLGLSLFDGEAMEISQPMSLGDSDVLVEALSDVAPDGHLILEGGPEHHLYAQAFGDGPDQLLAEAVSSHHLPSHLAPTPSGHRALLALGFSPPDRDLPNYSMSLRRATPGQRRFVAERMVGALVDAYGATRHDVYRLRSSAGEHG